MMRPASITILSLVYILAGAAGIIYHAPEWKSAHSVTDEIVWVSLIRLLAIVCGVFMLRRQNWARWTALIWMAFHVAISVVGPWSVLAMHTALMIIFVFLLFRAPARQYFATSTA